MVNLASFTKIKKGCNLKFGSILPSFEEKRATHINFITLYNGLIKNAR